MAAQPAARTPFQPTPVIDLTSSDDEDELQYRATPDQPTQASAIQLAQALPPSNHGLILPGTFDSIASHSIGGAQDGNHGVALHMYAQSLGVSGLGTQPQTSIRPQTKANVSGRSTGQSFTRTVDTAADRRKSFDENPAKRRKIYGRMASQQTHAPAPFFSPQPPTTVPAAKCQRILPSEPAAILSPNRSVTKADRLQADKLRLPLNNVIQNQQKLPDHTVEVPKPQEASANYVVCQQVVEAINSALVECRERISKANRITIAQKVSNRLQPELRTAEKLVHNNGFEENLKLNKWTKLSKEYEERLGRRARFFVGYYAAKILSGESIDSVETRDSHENSEESLTTFKSSKSSSFKAEKSINVTSKSDPVPNRSKVFIDSISTAEQSLSGNSMDERLISPSNGSESEEDVFEAPSEMAQFNNRASRYSSSSPTTSFSIDTNDPTSPMDLDIANVTVAPSRSPKRRSLRQVQISKASNLEHTTRAGDPSLPPKLKQPSGMPQRKLEISALRQAQALRLAGGNKDTRRPYLSFRDREDIQHGCKISVLSRPEQDLLQQSIFHVDFCLEELEFLCKVIQGTTEDTLPLSSDVRSQIIMLMGGRESIVARVLSIFQKVVNLPGPELGRALLRKRDTADIKAFLRDAVEGKIAAVPQVIRIETVPRQKKTPAKPLISSLLWQREIYGLTPIRVRRGQQSYKVEISSHLEDTLVRKSEWTDCCGDISTLSWTGEGTFVCGATAHSDFYNMQYNKPGNLTVGSTSLDTLRAVEDHRIIRPIVDSLENADNALESMRQTQDPWLYTSVVSSSHCEKNGFTFTASFDHTVKIWKVAETGSSIDLCGTWLHDGKVNFVVTSQHDRVATASEVSSSPIRVATASEVSSNAIRVYNFEEEDIDNSKCDFYCGEKALEQADELFRRESWAYLPATIQWGKAAGVVDFLLVGYSPRSVSGHESDIPEDKRNTGELCLWNVETGTPIQISSARTQNVFEVMWHPTQPCFLAATSPCGTFEPDTKTQIRLFAQNESGTFMHIKILDCPASDINELTIMPNSFVHCYVTASCTDGNTYVWDTASEEDRPIHTLGHGESLDLDNLIHDVPHEITDSGVKFASWGKTADRLYTGSSDGKVKAWDIRKPKGNAFVRTVLSVSGGITAGAFSKNFSKLLLGDATGKVHLLGIDEGSDEESGPTNAPHSSSAVLAKGSDVLITNPEDHYASAILAKRPKVIIPHPEPPPPAGLGLDVEEEMTSQDMAQYYIDEGQLAMHPDPAIGAIQGPNYAETLLFRKEAHENDDPALPLLPGYQVKQRYQSQSQEERLKLPSLREVASSDQSLHERNMSLDFNFSGLSLSTQEELVRDGVDLDFEPAQDFNIELLPRFSVFKEHKKQRKQTHNI